LVNQRGSQIPQIKVSEKRENKLIASELIAITMRHKSKTREMRERSRLRLITQSVETNRQLEQHGLEDQMLDITQTPQTMTPELIVVFQFQSSMLIVNQRAQVLERKALRHLLHRQEETHLAHLLSELHNPLFKNQKVFQSIKFSPSLTKIKNRAQAA